MERKLNVWERIGVVLTVVWLCFGTLVGVGLSKIYAQEGAEQAYRDCIRDSVHSYTECTELAPTPQLASLGDWLGAFTRSAIAAAVAWGFVWLAIWTVKWVWAGVDSKSTSEPDQRKPPEGAVE